MSCGYNLILENGPDGWSVSVGLFLFWWNADSCRKTIRVLHIMDGGQYPNHLSVL